MDGRAALVGKVFELRFDAVDATPDLHEMGPVEAKVEAVALEGSPPTPRITAKVLSPSLMRGLRVTASLRYEGETLEMALGGKPVGATVAFEDRGGRAVGGGLGTLAFKRA